MLLEDYMKKKPPQLFIFWSIPTLHLSEKVFIDQITTIPLIKLTKPNIVNSHPLPMAAMIGAATTPPTQEKMFLTKLLTAMPVDACLGINSVSMVVDMAKMIIEPMPKKKFAIIYIFC
jgi:hypothetical protein